MFIPRFYQEKGIQSCLEILNSNKKCREIVVAPTAAGKSWYTAMTVQKIKDPIIIIQPNRELLLQNYQKYIDVGGKATICCASLKTKVIKKEPYVELENGSLVKCREISQVTFATVGSIIKHTEELKSLGIKKLLVDECHLMTQSLSKNKKEKPSQIKKLTKILGVTNICGLTATPLYLQSGLNGSQLKMMNRVRWKLFTNIRHVTQIKELVNAKPKPYWSKLIYKVFDTDQTILDKDTSKSDFDIKSLKEYYKSNNLKNRIIEELVNLKKEGRKSIMVFLNSIEEAEELYKLVPNSAIIHSNIDLKTRTYFVRAFKNLEIPVVFNINCLATGFDHTKVDAIITARPTASIALFYQQIGRGVRIDKSKKNCKIIDFSGNVNRFGKVEDLHYENVPYYGWGLFNGKNELLTNFPIRSKNRPTKESLLSSGKKEAKNKKQKENPTFTFGMFKGRKLWDIAKSKDAKRLKSYCSWVIDEYQNGKWKFYGEEGLNLKKGICEYLKIGEVKPKTKYKKMPF